MPASPFTKSTQMLVTDASSAVDASAERGITPTTLGKTFPISASCDPSCPMLVPFALARHDSERGHLERSRKISLRVVTTR